MSDLPSTVQQAGLLFQKAVFQHDRKATQDIIDWGYKQIELEYPADPIRAPLNLIRRAAAQREWQRVIRTSGRDLRGTIAAASVRELEFQLQRRREGMLAQDQEQGRRDARRFDTDLEVETYIRTKGVDLEDWKIRDGFEQARQEAQAQAESRRRMEERTHDAAVQISILLNEAVIKSMGSSSADKVFETADRVNASVLEIRRNDDLSPDEKHVQIKTLLDTLPHMLRGIRPNDV